MILKKEEKKRLDLKLASENNNYRRIAKMVHISFKDIGEIIRKYNGEETDYKNKNPSVTSKAFQMFKDNKGRVEVAIALDLEANDIVTFLKIFLSYRVSIS